MFEKHERSIWKCLWAATCLYYLILKGDKSINLIERHLVLKKKDPPIHTHSMLPIYGKKIRTHKSYYYFLWPPTLLLIQYYLFKKKNIYRWDKASPQFGVTDHYLEFSQTR